MSVSELKYPKNRLRRTRQAKWIRNLTQESMLSSNDLVWPVFVCEGNNIKDEIQSMPNVCLLYTSPSPRDWTISRMPSSA